MSTYVTTVMRVAFLTILLILPLSIMACQGGDDYVERMATEHAHDVPVASPMTAEAPSNVHGRPVVYSTGEGSTATGYLSVPEGASTGVPGVIVIHEWWGLNDNIRMMADKLAGEGYAALVVDLYGGQVAENPEQARTYMQAAMGDIAQARANLVGAYSFLADSLGSPRIGSVGWCFGGGMSLEAALALPNDLDATVIYYGRTTPDPEVLRPLNVPIVGFFGADDGGIPVDGVRAFEAALKSLEKDVEITIYEGAGHGFANPSGTGYRAEAAEDAWARTKAFFARHLAR